MSDEVNDFEALFGDSENDDEKVETDPAVVAFLDQQSAEFNANSEKLFAERYGFTHKCRCDQDYTEGNMVEVTECYANMTLEALDAAATLFAENKLLRLLIRQAMGGLFEPETGTDTVAGPGSDGAEVEGESIDAEDGYGDRGDTFA